MSKFLEATTVIPIIAGALPLFIYPFVLFANIMSYASQNDVTETNIETTASLFFWGTTIYPVVYFIFLLACYISLKTKFAKLAFVFSTIPLFYFAILVSLFEKLS